ncbi:MAG: response regulator transcription factor [Candidatus Omnitrophica bacterium]|nr:response regulator transcription factor [Candidatus Omnitrophota bacterium]
MRILVVEDEKKLASFVERGLKEQHYAVDTAYTGPDALFMAVSNSYDLIILDWMLPGKDGITVCKELREKNISVPILLLTAKGDIDDKVTGLDAGADDYLTKPFSFKELLARVRVLLRRQSGEKQTELRVADLVLNQATRKVHRAGREIELTSTEYALLEYLMIHAGEVVTRTMISEHVWNDDFDTFTNVINVYVSYLRKKMDTGYSKQLIHSVRGVGYMIKGS